MTIEDMNRRPFIIKQILFIFFFIFLSMYPLSASAAAPPVIFYTDIIAGPQTGGENNNGSYLSIFGKNFGNNLSNVKVYIGGGEVARYIYLGSSYGRPDVQQLSVQLGPNVNTGPIIIKVGGIDSNTDKTFTVRSGNFYYVSKTGNDTTGVVNDITHPYRTPNKIIDLPAFSAGDFIVIRGGTYDLSSGTENLGSYNRWIELNGKSGSSETMALTVYGYPGETVTAYWGTLTTGVTGIKTGTAQAYWTFANIVFDLGDTGGVAFDLGSYNDISVYVDYPRLVNLKVTGGMYNGTQDSTLQQAYTGRAKGIKMYGVGMGNQSRLAIPGLRSHILYVAHVYTNGDYGWLYIHDNAYGRAAMQVAGDRVGGNNEHSDNNTTSWGLNTNVRIHDSIFRNLPAEAILCNLGSKEIFIYNNIVDNVSTKGGGSSPIALRGASGADNGDYYLFNNTIYSQAVNYGMLELGMYASGDYPHLMVFYNNIFYAKTSNTLYWSNNNANMPLTNITSDYNIWYGSSSSMPSWHGTQDISSNPLFTNVSMGDFTLQSGSPAIGVGTSVLAVRTMVRRDHVGLIRAKNIYSDIGYDMGALQSITNTIFPETPSLQPTP